MFKVKNTPFTILAIVMIVSTLIAKPFDTHRTILPTYFNYIEEDVKPLYQFDSSKEMNRDELKKWDDIVFHLIIQNEQEDSSRIYAYLYTAQRDAAFLSYNIKQRFEGSLNPVSRKVLMEFFPQLEQVKDSEGEDAYSNLLADIVIAKVKARMVEDQRSTKPYKQKVGEQYWIGEKEPFYGQAIGSWKTWFIKSGSQFRAPPPPPYGSPFWQDQLRQVKEACEHATPAQKEAILYWAGLDSDETNKNQNGDWGHIANDYMWKHDVSFPKLLLVRSILAMTIADAAISVFDSKYTYWVKRPSMMDKEIRSHLPNPNHLSYPSGHSTISGAASTIMTYFFPESQERWEALAREAGLSRIWCGIHFPIDDIAGRNLGRSIGHAIIEILETKNKKINNNKHSFE